MFVQKNFGILFLYSVKSCSLYWNVCAAKL